MRGLLTLSVLAGACLALAQSSQEPPHVFRRGPKPRFDGTVLEYSSQGVVIKRDTDNIASSSLFNKRQVTRTKRQGHTRRQGLGPALPLTDPGADPSDAETSFGSPLNPNPDCYSCPSGVNFQSAKDILRVFTTQYFTGHGKLKYGQLENRCLFYTRGLQSGGPVQLSKRATQVACRHNKYSIWHLWTNKIDEAADPKNRINHYGPYLDGNKLRPLTTTDVDDPPPGQLKRRPYVIEYFENMSQAMANMCTGTIYLYTTEPTNLAIFYDWFVLDPLFKPLWPNIWATTESTALLTRINRDIGDLITIDAKSDANTPPAYRIEWDSWKHLGDGHLRRDVGNYSEDNLPPGVVPYDLSAELWGPKTEKETNLARRAVDFCLQFEPEEPDGANFFA